MQRDDAPILEFDPSPTAVIEPTEHIDPTDIPHHAVLCFFQDVIAKAVDESTAARSTRSAPRSGWCRSTS